MIKTEIRMQLMITDIKENIAKNGSKYLILKTKHTINTDKDLYIFVGCIMFKGYEDIIKNFKVGDEVIAMGEFRISNYKAKDNTYKNSYDIFLTSLINVKDYKEAKK